MISRVMWIFDFSFVKLPFLTFPLGYYDVDGPKDLNIYQLIYWPWFYQKYLIKHITNKTQI